MYVESGWRSPEHQAQLLREAVSKYGSEEEAARWVASPKTSPHVSGDAVDIGPAAATTWLSEHGAEYGLCQIYGNEPWHFELRVEAVDQGCPPEYADPTYDPRMQPVKPGIALAMVALILAGCSSEPAESGNTSTVNPTSTSSGGNKAVKFAECMRDNGVREFPDPDASGGLTIDGVVNGSSLDPSAPAWKTAIAACKDLQPSGFTGDGRRSAEEQDAALEFAQCIRDNGVEDFPDPVNGEPFVDTNRIPSAARDGGMTILNAAMRTCGDLIRDQLGRE